MAASNSLVRSPKLHCLAAMGLPMFVMVPILLIVVGQPIGSVTPALASTLVVDPSDPSAYQTIQAALSAAINHDTIVIKNATYIESLTINKHLTIEGESRRYTILSGNDTQRPLLINSGTLVSISSLNITDGWAADGGGIHNDGILTLTKVTLSENIATNNGGAIINDGNLYLDNVTLYANTAAVGGAGSGGGLYNSGSKKAVLNNVFIDYNTSAENTAGGGISNMGTMTITNSTMLSNTASIGGGIIHQGLLTLRDSTLGYNHADDRGGAIFSNGGIITITNTTIAKNTADTSGAGVQSNAGGNIVRILNVTFYGNIAPSDGAISHTAAPTTYLKNTLFLGNRYGNCGPGTDNFISEGHNLEDGNTCNLHATGDITSTNALLGPLGLNPPGSTQTMALLAGSPGIDDGDNNGCPPTDQRGVHRPLDGDANGSYVCDIGAYERMMDIYLPLILR